MCSILQKAKSPKPKIPNNSIPESNQSYEFYSSDPESQFNFTLT